MTDEIQDYDDELQELEDEIAKGIKQLSSVQVPDDRLKVLSRLPRHLNFLPIVYLNEDVYFCV